MRVTLDLWSPLPSPDVFILQGPPHDAGGTHLLVALEKLLSTLKKPNAERLIAELGALHTEHDWLAYRTLKAPGLPCALTYPRAYLPFFQSAYAVQASGYSAWIARTESMASHPFSLLKGTSHQGRP